MAASAGKRPRAVALASVLLWVVFAIALALTSGRLVHAFPFAPAVIQCMLAIVFALLATLVCFVFRGHDWARITVVSLIGIRTVVAVSRASSEFAYSSGAAATSLALAAVELYAAYLLLSRPSNAWFKGARSYPR